jgi:hypothetical protein
LPVKILLDHCLPRRLVLSFPSHSVSTAADKGWERLRNGKLLAAAADEFDVFLTIDKNLKHEQNLSMLPIAVMVVMSKSNRLADLLPFVSAIADRLASLERRAYVEVFMP